MRYGRFATGERWHMIRATRQGEKAMCHCPGSFVETRDSKPENEDDVCQNCDGWLREKGVAARKAAKRQVRRADVYVPRHQFEKGGG